MLSEINSDTLPRAYFFSENNTKSVRFICPPNGCGIKNCKYKVAGEPFGIECSSPYAIRTALQVHSRLFISTLKLVDNLVRAEEECNAD